MILFDDIVKIEEKYKEMEDGVSLIFSKINEDDAVRTMQGCFRSFLEKKGVDSPKAFAISEVFAYDLMIFEEAMEEERKKRFFDFVSSTFSNEFLKGKEEKKLFDKILKRIARKFKREKRENEITNNLKN